MPAFPLDHPHPAVTVTPSAAVAGDARRGRQGLHDPVRDVLPLDPRAPTATPERITLGSLGLEADR